MPPMYATCSAPFCNIWGQVCALMLCKQHCEQAHASMLGHEPPKTGLEQYKINTRSYGYAQPTRQEEVEEEPKLGEMVKVGGDS